jgi:citrate synthase
MSSGSVISGLQDVLACESSICEIDGAAGRLSYRGYDIRDVAEHLGFEETAFLLWNGQPPTSADLAELDTGLRALRAVPELVLGVLKSFDTDSDPVAVLRAGISVWAAMHEASDPGGAKDADIVAKQLTAKIATMLAAIHRSRLGEEAIEPSEELRHAANLLYMLNGKQPTATESAALETVLVLYAEHELNASTFTARVTVGTLADPYSAVIAALCALKGPLHGGAVNDVMDMLTEVGTPERAGEWVSAAFAEKRKIPGFGHRVYRVEDPRASYLRGMALRLAEQAGESRWIDTALSIEKAVAEFKPLKANVDYFTAPVLSSLGIPEELFTGLVAASRVTGWMAHVKEQYADNRLIRPRAAYRGEKNLSLEGRVS